MNGLRSNQHDLLMTNSLTDEVAVMETTEGRMVLEFWPDVAPNHVENFKKLARQGFTVARSFNRASRGS